MIAEDYVSFETAKLLKEKGFDWEVHRSYLVNDNVFIPGDINDVPLRKDAIRIPTLQMAMKWLRENFNMNPVPYALSIGWAFDVFDLSDRDITGCKKLYSMDFPTKNACFETYEQACESAIKYCLENLI